MFQLAFFVLTLLAFTCWHNPSLGFIFLVALVCTGGKRSRRCNCKSDSSTSG